MLYSETEWWSRAGKTEVNDKKLVLPYTYGWSKYMCVLIIKQRDKIESKNSAQLAKTHPDAIYNL